MNQEGNTSPQDWEKAFAKEWKGQPESAYQQKTNRGIPIRPFYTLEDVLRIPPADLLFQQQAQVPATPYRHTVEMIGPGDEVEMNQAALRALEDGASSLLFYFYGSEDFSKVLKSVQAEIIPIHCVVEGDNPKDFLERWELGWTANEKSLMDWNGSLNMRISAADWAPLLSSLPPSVRCFCINGGEFSLPNRSDEEVLAWAAAEMELGLQCAASTGDFHRFWLHWSLQDDALISIVSLRALRVLWAKALQPYGITASEAPLWICAQTAFTGTSENDPYTPLISSALQTFSATAGGADERSITPFSGDHPEALRWARHQSLIASYESGLDKEMDPLKGSFAIECLTYAFTEWAWSHKTHFHGGY